MSTPSPGEILADARKGLGMTQARLAETLGVSTVLISKLESGARAPSEAFLRTLAAHLPVQAEAVRAAVASTERGRERASGSLKIVDAMRLAKQNADRGRQLRTRADQIEHEANAAAQRLDEKVAEFRRDVFGPVTAILARIADLPEDVLIARSPSRADPVPALAQEFDDAQRRTSRNVFALISAGVFGDVAENPGAEAATYMTVAGLAFASTGAAISGLSGTSATSAALAAIGGGGLAAGGLGIAGTTAVLTGIVGVPVALAAASAMVASGGRILDKQKAEEQRVRGAEEAFGANEAVLRRFVARAGRITEILTVAVLATRNHRRIIEAPWRGEGTVPEGTVPEGTVPEGTVPWGQLEVGVQASVRRLVEITLGCLTVLSLPIGMSLKQGAPAEAPSTQTHDGATVPPLDRVLDPRLDDGPGATNEFIDYAIEESFGQIAK